MLYLTLWDDFDERPIHFIGQWPLRSDYSFDTRLPGGFGSGSFVLSSRYSGVQSKLFDNLMGRHVVVFDGYTGGRAYEGHVVSADRKSFGDGITITTEGYFTLGAKKIHGLVYNSTPVYASTIVSDTIHLATDALQGNFWNHGDAGITPTTIDLGMTFDFTGDVKLNDVITKMMSLGYTATDLRSMHFGIYDERTAWFFPEPKYHPNTVWWLIGRDNLVGGISVTSAQDEVYNKVYALYDDPNGGPTLTTVEENLISQAMYDSVKEGVINVGQVPTSVASILQKIYLKDHAFTLFKTSFTVSGMITPHQGGPRVPVHHLRAGDFIRVFSPDYDISDGYVFNAVPDNPSMSNPTEGMILSTSYNSSGELSIELGARTQMHDIIVERLGLVSGVA